MREFPSPIVDALPPGERQRLLDRAVLRHLEPDDYLHLRGERTGRVYFVANGILKCSGGNASGDETILYLAVPGDLIGEIAALDGLQEPLDAIAATSAGVLGIDAQLFLDVLADNGRAALEAARASARRSRWMAEMGVERTMSEVPARLAGRLLDLADVFGRVEGGSVAMDLPLAQADLAKLAGMCRESASRALCRFRKQGLLDYRGRNVRLLRPDLLERIRCAGRGVGPSRSAGVEARRRTRSGRGL